MSSYFQNSRNLKKTPLFEFLSFQDVHGPLQYLHEYSSLFEEKNWSHNRKIISRKISIVDHYIGLIVKALKEKGFWQNTVLVVTSDNGGAREEGASNWPLRGSKGTILEGGIKGRAFVHSPIIPERVGIFPELSRAETLSQKDELSKLRRKTFFLLSFFKDALS